MDKKSGLIFLLALSFSLSLFQPAQSDQLMMQGFIPESNSLAEHNQNVYTNPNSDNYKNRAGEYKRLGFHKEAMDDINQALSLEPRDVISLTMKSEVYFQSGMFHEAISSLSEAIKIDPKFVGARVLRTRSYLRLREYAKALADANELMPLCSNKAEPLLLRGASYEGLGKYESAVSDLTDALKSDPKLARAYFYRAKAHQDAGEYQKAVDDFSQFLNMQGFSREALLARAWCNYRLGNDAQAIADCSSAIKFNNADVLKAVDRFIGQKATNPDITPDPEYYLGMQVEDDMKNAVVLYDDVLKDKPGDSDALRDRGIVYMHMGKYREAQRDFEAANKGVPQNPTGFSGLGSEEAYNAAKPEYDQGNKDLSAGKYMDSLNHYRAALEKYPQYARCWHNMALDCAYLRDYFSSELCSIHAISYRPDDWKLWHTLGYSLYQEYLLDKSNPEKLPAAANALHEALLLKPDSEQDKSNIRKLLADVKGTERSLAPISNFVVTTMPIN